MTGCHGLSNCGRADWTTNCHHSMSILMVVLVWVRQRKGHRPKFCCFLFQTYGVLHGKAWELQWISPLPIEIVTLFSCHEHHPTLSKIEVEAIKMTTRTKLSNDCVAHASTKKKNPCKSNALKAVYAMEMTVTQGVTTESVMLFDASKMSFHLPGFLCVILLSPCLKH